MLFIIWMQQKTLHWMSEHCQMSLPLIWRHLQTIFRYTFCLFKIDDEWLEMKRCDFVPLLHENPSEEYQLRCICLRRFFAPGLTCLAALEPHSINRQLVLHASAFGWTAEWSAKLPFWVWQWGPDEDLGLNPRLKTCCQWIVFSTTKILILLARGKNGRIEVFHSATMESLFWE